MLRRGLWSISWVVVLLAASVAHADAVADLRAALAKLPADGPLAATLDARSSTHGDDQAKPAQAAVRVGVASDAAGLHLSFAPDLLRRVSDEATAHARDKTRPMPVNDLLDKLTVANVQPMVDFAPELRHLLDGAKLSGQREDTHAGNPAHLLVFDVPISPSAQKQMTVKSYLGRLEVWLDAGGIPVAVRETMAVHGRKLLISIDFNTVSSYELRVLGTRLLAVSRHTEESHSVFGHGGGGTIDATLAPVPAKPAG
jgi:hypothetical protein